MNKVVFSTDINNCGFFILSLNSDHKPMIQQLLPIQLDIHHLVPSDVIKIVDKYLHTFKSVSKLLKVNAGYAQSIQAYDRDRVIHHSTADGAVRMITF